MRREKKKEVKHKKTKKIILILVSLIIIAAISYVIYYNYQKMQQDKTTHLVISRRGIIHPIKTKREIVLDPDKGFKQVYPLPRMANLVNSAER